MIFKEKLCCKYRTFSQAGLPIEATILVVLGKAHDKICLSYIGDAKSQQSYDSRQAFFEFS